MQQQIQEVYSHLIPISDGRIIVPRTAVKEIMGFTAPKVKSDDAPDWFLGIINWQEASIPVVSFEAACGRDVPKLGRRTRIAVIQCIAGLLDPPVFALVTQGYPYLVRVNAGVLQFDEQSAASAQGPVLSAARMANERPVVPDLEKIESMLANVMGIESSAKDNASDDVLDGLEDIDVGSDLDVGDVGIEVDEEVDGDLEIDTRGIEVEDTGDDLDLGMDDDTD